MDILFFFLTLPIAIPMHFILRSNWGYDLAKKLPRHPRVLHCALACWGGYYWLPCKMCNRYFAGHERKGYLAYGPWGGISVCIVCADEAERKNQEMYESDWYREALTSHYSRVLQEVYK